MVVLILNESKSAADGGPPMIKYQPIHGLRYFSATSDKEDEVQDQLRAFGPTTTDEVAVPRFQ